MSWTQKDNESQSVGSVEGDRSREYDMVRQNNLPKLQKEADDGEVPVQPVEFQPVRSPGIYEGEFGVKMNDLLFHFWPSGYHDALKKQQVPPSFPSRPVPFEIALSASFTDVFGKNRVEVKHDGDMGAYFVKATGFGVNQFHREMAIRACEKLHAAMGGKQG